MNKLKYLILLVLAVLIAYRVHNSCDICKNKLADWKRKMLGMPSSMPSEDGGVM